MTVEAPIYGLMAEFETPEQILRAARQVREEGYTRIDAYTPYPIEGMTAELDLPRSPVPFVVLLAGIVGASVGFFMQYWSMAVDYPFNVGGRPHNSWPVFLPIAFEVMVLVAGFAALFGMLFLNGLPRPHHPVFNVPNFDHATQDRFFLCIEVYDPKFDREETKRFLGTLGANDVVEVPQ